jgi:hypothetical protein
MIASAIALAVGGPPVCRSGCCGATEMREPAIKFQPFPVRPLTLRAREGIVIALQCETRLLASRRR